LILSILSNLCHEFLTLAKLKKIFIFKAHFMISFDWIRVAKYLKLNKYNL